MSIDQDQPGGDNKETDRSSWWQRHPTGPAKILLVGVLGVAVAHGAFLANNTVVADIQADTDTQLDRLPFDFAGYPTGARAITAFGSRLHKSYNEPDSFVVIPGPSDKDELIAQWLDTDAVRGDVNAMAARLRTPVGFAGEIALNLLGHGSDFGALVQLDKGLNEAQRLSNQALRNKLPYCSTCGESLNGVPSAPTI